MTQTATRRGAKQAAAATTKTIEIEVGRGGQHVLNKLANLRLTRLLAERAEDPVKGQARALWEKAAADLNIGDVLIVKAMGIARGKVTLKKRAPQVDLGLLLSGWPEAYAACVNNEVYTPEYNSL